MTNNRVENLFSNIKEKWYKLTPSSPKNEQNVTQRKNLKRYGVFLNEENNFVSPAVSRFSESYYKNFKLEHIAHPNTFPFFITLNSTELDLIDSNSNILSEKNLGKTNKIIHTEGSDKYKILIDYYSETDSNIIFNKLSDLDKRILLFIATFRNVQFLQIVKETGAQTARVERSLERLHRYFLIDKWKFYRDPIIEGEEKGNLMGDCYSIYSHGTTLLLVHNLISKEYTYKWKEVLKEEDSFTPIRCWKIVDAFLSFRLKDDFVSYAPFSYMEAFEYLEEVKIPLTKKANNKNTKYTEQSQRIIQELKSSSEKPQNFKLIKKRRRVPRQRFNGQFVLQNNTGRSVKIDIYPFITKSEINSDMSKLGNVFKHYGYHLKNGVDENGDTRLLLIIVDNPSQIEAIEDRYHVSDSYNSLNNILFLDLTAVSEKDILSSLKVLVLDKDKQHKLKTAKFSFNKVLQGELA